VLLTTAGAATGAVKQDQDDDDVSARLQPALWFVTPATHQGAVFAVSCDSMKWWALCMLPGGNHPRWELPGGNHPRSCRCTHGHSTPMTDVSMCA
jgi:hypothetical protein